MKKFIFATMVAILMLVGIQPAFAEQFIVPEVSTSDSQCFVLDLPAGATAETPEYVAPWQVPEMDEVKGHKSKHFDGSLYNNTVTLQVTNISTSFFGVGITFDSFIPGPGGSDVTVSYLPSGGGAWQQIDQDPIGSSGYANGFSVSAIGIKVEVSGDAHVDMYMSITY